MTIGIYGPKVVGSIAPEAPAVEPEAEGPKAGPEGQGGGKPLSTRELDAALKANPALVDGLLELELAREPNPRKTALQSLLAAETGEGGGQRPEVVAAIQSALGAEPDATDAAEE